MKAMYFAFKLGSRANRLSIACSRANADCRDPVGLGVFSLMGMRTVYLPSAPLSTWSREFRSQSSSSRVRICLLGMLSTSQNRVSNASSASESMVTIRDTTALTLPIVILAPKTIQPNVVFCAVGWPFLLRIPSCTMRA